MKCRCFCAGLGIVPPASLLASMPTFSAPPTAAAMPVLAMPSDPMPSTAPGTPLATPLRVGGQQSWALPAKLVKRILDLEYVDMAELVPDSWCFQEEEEASKCCHQPKRHRQGPITNILLWVECYASMVEVLCSAHPEKVGGFLSYLRTIVRAHIRGRRLGNIRHVLQAQGCCRQIAGVGPG